MINWACWAEGLAYKTWGRGCYILSDWIGDSAKHARTWEEARSMSSKSLAVQTFSFDRRLRYGP
jgi:hypothetical protein